MHCTIVSILKELDIEIPSGWTYTYWSILDAAGGRATTEILIVEENIEGNK